MEIFTKDRIVFFIIIALVWYFLYRHARAIDLLNETVSGLYSVEAEIQVQKQSRKWWRFWE